MKRVTYIRPKHAHQRVCPAILNTVASMADLLSATNGERKKDSEAE